MRVAILLTLLGVVGVARAETPEELAQAAQARRLVGEAAELEQKGQFAQAVASMQQALTIAEKLFPAGEEQLGVLAQKLGYLHLYAAEYDRAEPRFLQAMAIFEKNDGKQSATVLSCLNGLATVYFTMGEPLRAEPLYRRALELVERVSGPESQDAASLSVSLGAVYLNLLQPDRALPLYQRGLAFFEKQLGPNDANLGAILGGLASVYDLQGKYDESEKLTRRVVTLREKAQGPNHPQTALAINNLANTLLMKGDYQEAEALSRRSVKVTEAAFGANHPQLTNLLSTLAFILAAEGKSAESVGLLRRAAGSAETILRNARLVSTESRMSAFLKSYAWHEEFVYSLVLERPNDPEVQKLALAMALLRKGRSVDEAADLSRVVQQSLGPDDEESFEKLKALRSRIANAVYGGPGTMKPAELAAQVSGLEREAEALEQSLAGHSAALRAQTQLPGVGEIVASVQKALPPDSVLVEVVTLGPYLFKAKRGEVRQRELRYLALLLFPDGKTGAVDLGPAQGIDGAVQRLLASYNHPSATIDLAPGQALYQLVMAPLEPALDGKRHLLLSLDGQLHLVPFAALSDGKQYLGDRYELEIYGSGRDLLRAGGAPSVGVTVLADPAFAAGAPTGKGAATAQRKGALIQGKIAPLPGTRKEADAIRKLWPTARMLLGGAATEQSLLSVKAPGILHVATHGVFLADLPSASDGARGLKLVKSDDPQARGPSDPLLRSALVLAGAEALASRPPASDQADGLATALELAGMNLWGTQLVVLSACDTGRGDVRLGQGVYGLRRAVLIAGAETLVTSLWRVDDDATRDLMTRFYKGLFTGKSRAEALRQASLEVRKSRPHPYFWAPFVLVGRGDPLRGWK